MNNDKTLPTMNYSDDYIEKIIDTLSENASKLADHYDRLNEKFLHDAQNASSPEELAESNARAAAAFIYADVARYFNENKPFFNDDDKSTIADSFFGTMDLRTMKLFELDMDLSTLSEWMDSINYCDAYTMIYDKYIADFNDKEPATFPFVPHKLYGECRIEDENLIPTLISTIEAIEKEAHEKKCRIYEMQEDNEQSNL